jgi:hypothetical protein
MGMIYDLAVVEDHGSQWRVANVQQNTLDGTVDRNEKLLKLSYMSYQLIKEAILNNKTVYINKTLLTNEVLPGEFKIVDVASTDPLQDARNAASVKVRMIITPELSKVSSLALYGFTVLNNDMVNAGYAITNENREEKYLEILETGDEKLIAKLEDYLNYKDEIEAVAHIERKFSAFRAELKSTTTIEEVKQLEARFLDSIYRNY